MDRSIGLDAEVIVPESVVRVLFDDDAVENRSRLSARIDPGLKRLLIEIQIRSIIDRYVIVDAIEAEPLADLSRCGRRSVGQCAVVCARTVVRIAFAMPQA